MAEARIAGGARLFGRPWSPRAANLISLATGIWSGIPGLFADSSAATIGKPPTGFGMMFDPDRDPAPHSAWRRAQALFSLQ
jgi:hypothetical protein